VVGAILLQILPQALSFLQLPAAITGPLQGIMFTGLVLVFLFVMPNGVLGKVERKQMPADEDDAV
jgi:branched-chain amino acid transport system permease protein